MAAKTRPILKPAPPMKRVSQGARRLQEHGMQRESLGPKTCSPVATCRHHRTCRHFPSSFHSIGGSSRVLRGNNENIEKPAALCPYKRFLKTLFTAFVVTLTIPLPFEEKDADVTKWFLHCYCHHMFTIFTILSLS